MTNFTKNNADGKPDHSLTGLLSSPVIKRSVHISGHSTSISLEQPFWDELIYITKRDDKSLSQIISEIDEIRGGNLSSAIRLYILYDIKSR